MSENLKPCPFCGERVICDQSTVDCLPCGAGVVGLSDADAIAAWNRRAPGLVALDPEKVAEELYRHRDGKLIPQGNFDPATRCGCGAWYEPDEESYLTHVAEAICSRFGALQTALPEEAVKRIMRAVMDHARAYAQWLELGGTPGGDGRSESVALAFAKVEALLSGSSASPPSLRSQG